VLSLTLYRPGVSPRLEFANAFGALEEIKRPAATFSWKVAAGFETFLRLFLYITP